RWSSALYTCLGACVNDPPMQGEGQERRDEYHRDCRPPGRTVHLLDQQPDEAMVDQVTEQVDGNEPAHSDVMLVTRPMAAEAEFAMGDVADHRKDHENNGEADHRIDMQ